MTNSNWWGDHKASLGTQGESLLNPSWLLGQFIASGDPAKTRLRLLVLAPLLLTSNHYPLLASVFLLYCGGNTLFPASLPRLLWDQMI